MEKEALSNEWCLLQNQFDSYEKHSLYIKLFSVFCLIFSYVYNHIGCVSVAVLAILWLQDGIWKTFQARIEERLLIIEKSMSEKHSESSEAYQFNADFASSRSGTVALIKEYVGQALRPTVAYPHVILLSLACIHWLVL